MHTVPNHLRRILAPSGTLRAAINLGNPVLAQRRDDGTLGGVSVVLAQTLAERLDVDIEFVVYDAAGKVVAARASDTWDLAFLARDPKRAQTLAFTAPYVIIEGTYLVDGASSYQRVNDLDRDGVAIAVGEGAAYDLYLSRTLQHADIVRAPTSADAVMWKVQRDLDAAAGVRQPLERYAKEHPGYRVIEGSFTRIEQAMAIPAERTEALVLLSSLLTDTKAEGQVRLALDESGQSDVDVAP
ncbi:transporter substrate-binding domain-containing protein [Halomonas sp. V046]|uniref:transporter substrate-binding domain-containing protein n=1 Tax=Halomonas sp. V046 TaxID=3459611 RepID=UPI004043BB09